MKKTLCLLIILLLVAFPVHARERTLSDTSVVGQNGFAINEDGDAEPYEADNTIGTSSYPFDNGYFDEFVLGGINLTATMNNVGTDGGTDGVTYTITATPAPTALATGMSVVFKAVCANTGAACINVNALGASKILMLNDQDPAANYIEAGSMVQAIYDGTNWQLVSPDANP